jgi:hypothetical protein
LRLQIRIAIPLAIVSFTTFRHLPKQLAALALSADLDFSELHFGIAVISLLGIGTHRFRLIAKVLCLIDAMACGYGRAHFIIARQLDLGTRTFRYGLTHRL